MKKLIRKAATVASSAAMIGMTVGLAAAASYPDPFTSNTAIVTGANAAPSDNLAATNIASDLQAEAAGSTSNKLTGGDTVTEKEVVLGGAINFSTSDIETDLTESDLPSLIDAKLSWDDGTGSEDYDVHETLSVVGNVKILTQLSDEELEGIAMSNEMGLEYKYVFEEVINTSAVGTSGADDLYLTILGKEYEITSMGTDTITVVTSEEVSLGIGESVTVDGKTFTVDDIFESKAQINGEVVSETGSAKKIDGMQVEVDTIGYHSNTPETSKVILKIGEDISKAYTDGDEYIGEDDEDPLWVWDIQNLGTEGGFIGVKYNANINDADDDDAGDGIKYVGDNYMFPNEFAQYSLDALTEVEYEEVKVTFEEVDLYNTTSGIDPVLESAKVIQIDAATTDSIEVGGEKSDKIYLFYAKKGAEAQNASNNGTIEIYYRDHDGDNTPSGKARYEIQKNLNTTNGLARVKLGTIEVGETIMDIDFAVNAGVATLYFENPSDEDVALTVGGTAIAQAAGTLERLGSTVEENDANDIVVAGVDVSAFDEGEVMDNYGIIVAEGTNPEAEADDDMLTMQIPDDQVYAEVTVTANGEASSGGESGVMTVKDNAVSTVAGKNLIVVGGSAINTVAADLLGGSYSEAAFTEATGVAAGEFLIQSFDRGSGNTALLVAGYNAADTQKAVDYLLSQDVDTTVGTKMKGTSATEAVVM